MKLLCIDDTKGPGSEYFQNWVVEGEIYTLRRSEGSLEPGKQRYLLKEIKNPPIYVSAIMCKVEPAFSSARFVVLKDDNVLEEVNELEKELV